MKQTAERVASLDLQGLSKGARHRCRLGCEGRSRIRGVIEGGKQPRASGGGSGNGRE